MRSEKCFLLFCLVCVVSLGKVCPGPVTKCSSEDSKCLKQSAQELIPRFVAGIPEFNVQSMDPLHIDSIDASSGNLKLFIKDMDVTGLKDCVAKRIERSGNMLLTRLQCDVRADGQYEMNGHLLVLPIEGKGKAEVVLKKLVMNVKNEMITRTGKDGKEYWHVKNWTYDFQLRDKAYVHFANLFSGNELLAKAANDLIASNGNDIVTEVGPPVIKAILTKIIENINRFYKAVPYEELSLN